MIGGVGANGIDAAVSGAILAAGFGISCTCPVLLLEVHFQQIQVTRRIGKASLNTSEGRARLAAHFLLKAATKLQRLDRKAASRNFQNMPPNFSN